MMIAALFTLIFLMVLALSAYVGFQMVVEHGVRIAAAVEGIPAAVSSQQRSAVA